MVLRLLMTWPFNKLFLKVLKGADGDTRPTMLKAMGSSKETIARLPEELGEAYYYFKRLPHYFISLTSLPKNAPPTIDALQLSQVKQRTQLLLGDKDTFASLTTGQSIANAMPNCTLHVIKGGSHLPWLEEATECGNLVNNFLNQL